MHCQNLNDLAEEILDMYEEWIEADLITVDRLLLTLLLKERQKTADLEQRLKNATKH